MIFDCMITNPPYGAGMHVDFVNLGVSTSRLVVALHPSGPFISRKPTNPNNRVKQLIDNMKKYKCSIELFDGNAVFDAGFFTPISLTVIDTNIEQDDVVVSGYYNAVLPVDQLNMIGTWVIKYYDRIKDENLYTMQSTSTEDGIYVNIGCIRGHPPEAGKKFNPDFFTMIPETTGVVDKPNSKWSCYKFNTMDEANNFLRYIKSKPARFYLSLYKMNAHLDSKELIAVPWIDFSKSYTDDELYDLLNIDKSDIELIDDLIADYYGGDRHKTTKADDARTFTSKIDKDRQQQNKEFFTPIDLVDKMIDCTDINGSYFEPSCGDGNIIYRVIERKILAGISAYDAISSIYACEYMIDNRNATIERILSLVGDKHRPHVEEKIAYCNTLDEYDVSDGRCYPHWLKQNPLELLGI